MSIRQVSIAVATTIAFIGSAASAADLKLADFQPPTHPYVENVYKPFAEEVSAGTNGEVTVTVFSGGELGQGPAEQYNRALHGVVDIAFGLPGYTASNFPKTLLTELPGVVSVEEGTEKLLANLDLLSNEYNKVVLLGLWTNAPNVLYTASKPVRTLADLKGMKIRVPSRNAGLIVASWGASPVSMPAPDIYNAMQTGVIDGAFIDGTATTVFRLSEVTKYITTGMEGSMSDFFLVMNRDSFGDLSKEQQDILLKAGHEAAFKANKVQLAGAQAGLDAFAKMEGKEIITLSPDSAAEFNAATKPVADKVIGELDAAGSDARAFVDKLSQ